MDRTKQPEATGSGFLRQARSHLRTSEILAFLLLAQAVWFMWMSAMNAQTVDFFEFWSISRAVSRQQVTNIYSLDGQRDMASMAVKEALLLGASDRQREATTMAIQLYDRRIEATGTPLVFTAIGGLSSGDFEKDRRRFVLVCMLCLVLSMLVLKNLLRFSVIETFLLIIFAAINYSPAMSDIGVGNLNEIQMFAIVLFIFFTARARPLFAGLALGSATMFKPTTAPVLLLAVIAGVADRDYRQLFRMLSGCLIAVGALFVATAYYFRNPAIWLDFFKNLLKTVSAVPYPTQNGNFSLAALLFRVSGAISPVILLILLVAFSWILFTTRRSGSWQEPNALPKEIDEQRRLHTAFAVSGGGIAIMLLSSPLVWLHYYLLLLPLSLYLLLPVSESKEASPHGGIRIRAIAAMLIPYVPLLMFSLLTEWSVGTTAPRMCAVVILATVLTLAIASYRIWQQRRTLNVPNPAS